MQACADNLIDRVPTLLVLPANRDRVMAAERAVLDLSRTEAHIPVGLRYDVVIAHNLIVFERQAGFVGNVVVGYARA